MRKRVILLLVLCLAGFSPLLAKKGQNNLNQWIQELRQGDVNTKRKAVEEIALIKTPQAMEFLYREIMISNKAYAFQLRTYTAEKMASSKSPHGFFYLFQSFTVANTTYFPKFKEAIYQKINKKMLLQLSRNILGNKASNWPDGKAFFVDLLSSKKVKKAARYVRGLVTQDPAPEVRKSAVFAILDLEGPSAASLIARALADKDEQVRKAAVLCLGEIGTPSAVKKLAFCFRDKSKEVRLSVVEIISRQKSKSLGRLLLRALGDSDREIRTEALRGLRTLMGDQAKGYFIKATNDGDWQIRQVATFHLKDFGKDPAFIGIYKTRLRDPFPQVASAAVWGLYFLKGKEATEAIIEGIRFLKEAPLHDAVDALKRLSGKDFATNYDRWREWWMGKKKTFTPQPEGDQTYYPKGAQTGNGRGTVLRQKPKFFGSVIESYHVGFIIDFSGSMSQTMTITEEDQRKGTFERSKPKTITARRIDVAKKELIAAIALLDPRAKFNVLLFGTDYTAWKEKAVVASPANKESAIQFVKNNSFKGATNLYDPLESVLNDRDIDTIYVLSDGAPNRGKYSSPKEILQAVKEINQKRKAVINTIGIGVISFTEDFLKDLALQNGGKFIKK